MFKLQPKPTFKARVPITLPGETRAAEIEVEFKHLSVEQVREFFEGLVGKTDAQALGEIVVGWSGVDQAFSPEALDTLLNNFPSASGSFFDIFRRELLEGRRKN